MSGPLNPPVIKGSGKAELPAYLANGVVGLRVRDNPLAAGMALLCGYSGLHPEKKIEAAAVAPYPSAANLALNGVWLSDVPHQLRVIDQAYDFASGELTRWNRGMIAKFSGLRESIWPQICLSSRSPQT